MVTEGRAYYDDLPTLRLIRYALNKGQNVVLLFRTRGLLDRGYLKYLQSFFPKDDQDRISATTVHKYKGAQENIVIVMDAFKRKYPLIHPTWAFYRIFDDEKRSIVLRDGLLSTVGDVTLVNIRKSEERLFYVAISRAENEMFILTKKDNESEFLINSKILSKTEKLGRYDYVDTKGRILLTVKVSNYDRRVNSTGRVKMLLKKDGYRCTSRENCWYKSFYLEHEDDDIPIFEEAWYKQADYINIEICDTAKMLTHVKSKIDGKLL